MSKPEYCHHCDLIVAPQEPGQIQYGDYVFHAACFKKHLQKIAKPASQEVSYVH